jgi:hypothetical protein
MRQYGKFLCKISENEELYLIESSKLVKYTNNWKYNRPPDKERVNEILKTIYNNTYINNPIHIAEIINRDNSIKYVCYDGNHRREAFKEYNNNNDDLLCMENKLLVINLLSNIDQESIKKRFKIMNSGCPVPELYIENSKQIFKDKIEKITKDVCNKYLKHKSISKSPQKPNFNRDLLINILFEKFKNIPNINENEIIKSIDNLNSKYEKGIHINLNNFSLRCIKKCKKNKCFLFLKKDFTEDLEFSKTTTI